MNPRVAVFCRTFLPRSQTFVYDAVTRLERYRASIFCVEREHADQFPFDDVRVGWPGYGSTLVAPNFATMLLREEFDVVHAHFGTMAVYALPYAKLARLPLVVSFHGYDVPLLDTARRLGPAASYA
ncbi:MAG TPA: glycosyltransferase, partial [Polyangiales bacterium]